MDSYHFSINHSFGSLSCFSR